MRSVAVVTATTGRPELEQTVASVAAQTYPCKHYVFFDGVEPRPLPNQVLTLNLPVKTGGDGVLNHGIVAASAYLVQEDLICWVDDDNWLEPEHVESLVEAIGENLWAHSLRKLVNADGTFWDYDDGESLGVWTGFVDLNCYMMDRKRLAVRIAPSWYTMGSGGVMVGDRAVYASIKGLPGPCSGVYSVNYRLNSRVDLRGFFTQANNAMRQKFPNQLPWRKA